MLRKGMSGCGGCADVEVVISSSSFYSSSFSNPQTPRGVSLLAVFGSKSSGRLPVVMHSKYIQNAILCICSCLHYNGPMCSFTVDCT